MWLRLGWVSVDRSKVFKRRSAEKVLSAVAVVTGMVKNILVSLYTSLNNVLLLTTPEEVRQGQKVNVISFSLPTSGMVFSRSLGDF